MMHLVVNRSRSKVRIISKINIITFETVIIIFAYMILIGVESMPLNPLTCYVFNI
jgi:hypothetical protein